MLDELVDINEKLGDWEMGFVESLSDQYDRTGKLSDRQLEKLVEVYERRVLGY